MTVACLVVLIDMPLNHTRHALVVAAWLITMGVRLTCWTRLHRIAQALERRQASEQAFRNSAPGMN